MILTLALLITAPGELGPPDALKRSFDNALEWKVCAMENAARYASMDERAELLVEAAMGRCTSKEQAYKTSLYYIAVDGKAAFLPQHIDQQVVEERKKIESEALSALLEFRLQQTQPKKKN